MADQLPDVLQSAGLTPHEVGWLQLHAEPVQRAEDGRAVAELWLQAAFHPPGSGRVELVDAATGTLLVEAPVPAVINGSAVRWRIPFQLPAGTTVVRYHVEAGVPNEAVRIRAPWRLLDTIELRLPEDDASTGLTGQLSDVGDVVVSPRQAALEVIHALHVAGVAPAPRRISGQQARPSGMKVHPARASIRELVSFVLPARAEEPFTPAIETLWMAGDPVDGGALRKRVRALPPAAGPTCPNCDAPLVPGGEFCPRCLGPVPGAQPPPLDVPVSMLPPLSAMAPHLKPPEAEAAAAAEEVPTCTLHPDHRSTGRCNRCGNHFCEDCASTDSPELCAKCSAEELHRAKAVVLTPQVYRDASLVHLALFFFSVVRPFIGLMLEYRHVFTVVDAVPFGFLGILLFGVRRPLALLGALGVDLLVLVDSYATEDWTRLGMALAGALLTTMFWLRLPDPDALPQQSA